VPPGTCGRSRELQNLQVDSGDVGQRLDLFVSAHIPSCSRSFAAQLIGTGHVRVADRSAKPGYRLKSGDRVSVELPPPVSIDAAPEPMDLEILYEDPDLLVLDKKAGVVVHPAPGHRSGTLVNALLFHCPDLTGIGGELRPGIVHRLDKDTSGILVVAKSAGAHRHLSAQFKARSVHKHYLALVCGRISEDRGEIDLPIGRHPTDRKRMSTTSRRSRAAQTAWRVAERFEGATLLEVELKTGRTHQIRVHCAALGYPVVGDPVYGNRRGRRLKRMGAAGDPLAGAKRQMLHAWRLTLTHPRSGHRLFFESPLPDDMARLLVKLRGGHQAASLS